MSRNVSLWFVVLILVGAAGPWAQSAAALELGVASPPYDEMKRWKVIVRAIVALGMAQIKRKVPAKIVAEFVIGSDGRVKTASLAPSTGNPSIDADILATIRDTKFPPPVDQKSHSVHISLEFK